MVIPIQRQLAKRMDVTNAAQDLHTRTLAKIERPLDQLIYLASTRDYNTGLYYHDGLAARFTQEVACQALSDCHREVFRQMIGCSLQELVKQIEGYMGTTQTSPVDFIAVWRGLEPYRVAVPVETDPVSIELFVSNIKIALTVLEERLNSRRAEKPGASQLQ